MSLLAMSIQGGVMVAVITLLRAVTLHRVPKRTFLILWGAVLARLLIPFSLPSGFSIYSLLARKASSAPAAAAAVPAALPLVPVPGQAASALPAHAAPAAAIPVWGILWGIGTLLCAAIFAAAYWRCCREFQMSLPVDSETARNWAGRASAAAQGRPAAIGPHLLSADLWRAPPRDFTAKAHGLE